MLHIAESGAQGKKVIPSRLSSTQKALFAEILTTALALPEEECPHPIIRTSIRTTKQEMELFRKLKDKRDYAAAQLGLNPSVIASKLALETVARNTDGVSLLPWQRTLLEI
jgi:ribonuclease D